MVEINLDELVEMGTGALQAGNKLYTPANIIQFLKLKRKDRVSFNIILDNEMKEYVLITKSKK